MGKRSNYEHRPADFYPTPRAAVLPLIPHLRGIKTFAEPCAGDGDLVRHLESFGLRCVYQGDIGTGQDALELTTVDINGAPIITNPPFSRESQPLLRRLIAHFQRIASTAWLLLPTDFASNQWFAPFLCQCSDIVAFGRVRWFAGTKGNSKENFAWYRFDARHSAGPVFHNNRGKGKVQTFESKVKRRICEQCGKAYEPQRSSSRFCSPACRQRAHYRKLSVRLSVTPEPGTAGTEVFRYVRHADVPRFTVEGWQATPALDGTHHGEYSVLMRRIERG